jgi:RNA polymerase sigma factor (sigma-70 family)
MRSDHEYDVELLLGLRNSESAAFATLYRRHAPMVLRYASARLTDRSAADDVTQDTFVVVWSKRMSASILDDSLIPWILTIARNLISNELRRQARHRRSSAPLADEHAARPTGLDELAWIRLELAKLSPVDRELCRLCLVEGLTFREAAQLVDSTEAAVSKRVQRARIRLRVSLGIDE